MAQPPYEITGTILKRVAAISEKTGAAKALFLDKPSLQLRKRNKISTIYASLAIEGNTLTEDQITALLDNKRVIGREKDIREVLNAIRVYENLQRYQPTSETSFLAAHKILMEGLMEKPGQFRTQAVGVVQGDRVIHLAPPASNVDFLMSELFQYLKKSDELALIKSCVFHYEVAFIHPFLDGNGRMARLWQAIILMETYSVFEYLPVESLIIQTQAAYYEVLATSDRQGSATVFIEYMLGLIDEALARLLDSHNPTMTAEERIVYYHQKNELSEFTRKDYMTTFKTLSTATASRDLNKAVAMGVFEKSGDKNKTAYKPK